MSDRQPDGRQVDADPDGAEPAGTDRNAADRSAADRNAADRSAAEPGGTEESTRRTELREVYRRQMLSSLGGWSGALIAAVPTTVFVIVNVVATLRVAIIAAIGSALLLAGYRLLRRQSVQQALSGLFGVVVAALIAARTGQERGYFLLGIITSFLYAVPFGLSVLFRRPLVGVAWEFLDPTPALGSTPWHRRRQLRLAYTWATLAATFVFLVRGVVQLALYRSNATGWLAFTRIAMGYPLFVLAIGFGFLVVSRARKRVTAD